VISEKCLPERALSQREGGKIDDGGVKGVGIRKLEGFEVFWGEVRCACVGLVGAWQGSFE
jgi:hypothetical protein